MNESTHASFAHVIYTDGACSGNPGPGGWAAIVGIDVHHPGGRVRELGGGLNATTNNQMELRATIEGIRLLQTRSGPVVLLTDSVYVIRGITQWVHGWRRRGWKNAEGQAVANQEYWEELYDLALRRKELGKIEWRYVRGHMGTEGNERCDEIAVAYSKANDVTLYDGTAAEYQFLISELPPEQPLPEMKSRTGPASAGGAAPTYLSLVNGEVTRHSSWAACEALVKGRSGAKFKKVTTEHEEKVVLQSWGVDPSRIQTK